MDPLTIMAIAQFGLGAIQGLSGLVNRANATRPTYKMPESVKEAVNLSNFLRQSDMPGYSNAIQQNNLAASNVLATVQQSGDALLSAPLIQQMQASGARNIAVENMRYKDAANRNYQEALMRKAEYQDREWQINKFAPYADLMRESQNQIGAGTKNIFGALDIMPEFSFNSGVDAGSGLAGSGLSKISDIIKNR